MHDDLIPIGNRIRKSIKESGLTQRAIADMSEKESASFRYTDGGKAKMQAWQDKYLEADWRVSVKLVRGKK